LGGTRIRRRWGRGGRLLLVVGTLADLFKNRKAEKLGVRLIAGPAPERPEDLRTLADLAARGLYRAVIERTSAFGEMAEAHRYVDTGRKRGSVVIAVQKAMAEDGARTIATAA
jgi:NADPH:quinone reductase-like Zn-dependent oxidoreductase